MTEKKILKALENNPAGLSIAELSKETKLHRNTISNAIKKLQNEGKVGLRKLGRAKVYYLKKYQGLHEFESGYAGKNISIGLGVSDLEDGYNAAVSASKQAVNQACPGEEPSFSLVFVSSRYNDQIKEVVEGLNTTLGENWIGCTTDREINSILGYCEGTINVLVIKTKYMHFGIGISEDYRRNPVEEGKKATIQAIENCPVDRSKFATMEFMRGTRNHFREIVRQPPYFVLVLLGGTYYENGKPIPGREDEFLEGIRNVVGPYVPVVGGSASEDAEKAAFEYKGENYVFAKGNFYKGGAVVAFVVSELRYGINLKHGYESTGKYGIISKVSDGGKVINEINAKPAVAEYCKLVGIEEKEFEKNAFALTTTNPICLVDNLGNIYPIVAIPLPYNSSLVSAVKCGEGNSVVIGKYNEEKCINGIKDGILEIIKDNKKANISFCIVFDCSVRRLLLKDKVKKEIENALNVLGKDEILVGFYTMGEIGSKKNAPARYNNITATILCVFDSLHIDNIEGGST